MITELLSEKILLLITVPAVAGFLSIIIPIKIKGLREIISAAALGVTLFISIGLFNRVGTTLELLKIGIFSATFSISNLNRFFLIFINLFGFLISIYSITKRWNCEALNRYYGYLLWVVGAASGVVISQNLFFLFLFWEITSLLLFLLIKQGKENAPEASSKTLSILGFADEAFLLGLMFIWIKAGTLNISSISISTSDWMGISAFILILISVLAKAGAVPFHSWIPTASTGAPVTIMALLPASIDKLLGIYMLVMISVPGKMFVSTYTIKIVLMCIGSVTIIYAVLLALVQHNISKLLSYHAVSQVGYMILGIGTGSVVGIIGGLFHMINNSIYKTQLFLSAGNVEKVSGTLEIEKLGGLARVMPVTFVLTVISALSISGIPPFNGFASKWLIYQGVLEFGYAGGRLWSVVFITAAMFGSALTLASFIKVLYSIFWGAKPSGMKRAREVNFGMLFPSIILAALCIGFGVFAQFPIIKFFGPAFKDIGVSVPLAIKSSAFIWSPTLATGLIIAGIIGGLLIYIVSKAFKVREVESFVGGERIDDEIMRVKGTEIYDTVKETGLMKKFYAEADFAGFDIKNLANNFGFFVIRILRSFHNGVLSFYLSWCILGILLLFIVIFKFWS